MIFSYSISYSNILGFLNRTYFWLPKFSSPKNLYNIELFVILYAVLDETYIFVSSTFPSTGISLMFCYYFVSTQLIGCFLVPIYLKILIAPVRNICLFSNNTEALLNKIKPS
jgi:hypothetical protein